MVDGNQGVRSSRTGSITPLDRRRMRKLDRAIAKLDYQIWILSAWNQAECMKARAKRETLDGNRKWLRHWMKSNPHPLTKGRTHG